MRHRRRILILPIVLGVGAVSAMDHAGLFGYRGEDRTRYHGAVATVTAILDAETIEVDMPDGRNATTPIHLRGIRDPATPGIAGDRGHEPSREAVRFLREHVLHRSIRLAIDPNHGPRDRRGRVSAYVYLEDSGEMLNEVLIQRGLADVDRRAEHVMQHRFTELAVRTARQRAGTKGVGISSPEAAAAIARSAASP